MNKTEEARVLWADNLRAFSVIAVVLLHVASEFVSDIDIHNPIYGSTSWWAGNIYASITLWCIPFFVMISGYFLLNKSESNTLFLKKRLRRILVPMAFWSVFYSLWIMLKHSINGDITTAYFTVAKGWVLGEPYYHLWYLFMIPFLYLVTPVLRVIIRSITQRELFVLVCLCFSLAMLSALSEVVLLYFDLNAKISLFTNDFLSYIGYFCLGGYIAKYNIKVKINGCLAIFIAALLSTLLGSYYLTHLYFYSYLSINVVAASIALFFLIKHYANKDLKLSHVAKLSFGIYLIHPLFIKSISSFFGDWLLIWLDTSLYIPLVALIAVACSFVMAWGMTKVPYLNRCI
ncbi:acyltransferase [Vibrio comitans]|uniref:acyltransferase n=1 Tax=Vibrio comitans TaxID=413401 RepID=UPI0011432FEE|nr:acyltransferase family protein [Vibrio comitans]